MQIQRPQVEAKSNASAECGCWDQCGLVIMLARFFDCSSCEVGCRLDVKRINPDVDASGECSADFFGRQRQCAVRGEGWSVCAGFVVLPGGSRRSGLLQTARAFSPATELSGRTVGSTEMPGTSSSRRVCWTQTLEVRFRSNSVSAPRCCRFARTFPRALVPQMGRANSLKGSGAEAADRSNRKSAADPS